MSRRFALACLWIAFPALFAAQPDVWQEAAARAEDYRECGINARGLMHGWIDLHMDQQTSLYSRGGWWNYRNEGADHYSSLVLIAHYVEPELNQPGGTLHNTMVGIDKYCCTQNGVPALYDLRTHEQGKPAQLIYLSEWLKDGLNRTCEIMAPNMDHIWFRHYVKTADAMIAEANRQGGMAEVFSGPEPSGNMLQSLPRLYVMTGDEKYLHAAEEIADSLLFGSTEALANLSFRDHGNENVPGLGELFALEGQLGRDKMKEYEPAMRRLLDRVVKENANPETGFLCQVETRDGKRTYAQPEDTWGYSIFTFDNYNQATGTDRYRAAVEKPLRWFMENRTRYCMTFNSLWPMSHSRDRWSDSYESFIILWSRYPTTGDGRVWLDWVTERDDRRHCSEQIYGCYRARHDDGSTGRNLVSHMQFQARGVRMLPFSKAAGVGGVEDGDTLRLLIASDEPWDGRLCFEPDRQTFKHGKLNWARINEMVPGYVARPGEKYRVTIGDGEAKTVDGQALLDGIAVRLQKPGELRVVVERLAR